MSGQSTQTVPTTVRVTREQHKALRKHSVSASVIVRVLLELWLNGTIDVDVEIAEENKRVQDTAEASKNKNSIAA
jgi:hypothetical protein